MTGINRRAYQKLEKKKSLLETLDIFTIVFIFVTIITTIIFAVTNEKTTGAIAVKTSEQIYKKNQIIPLGKKVTTNNCLMR